MWLLRLTSLIKQKKYGRRVLRFDGSNHSKSLRVFAYFIASSTTLLGLTNSNEMQKELRRSKMGVH
jgi:hypothetical protein